MVADYRLITIAISHYCEKARWALDYVGVDYQEQACAPLLHRLSTIPQGGKTVPILVTPTGRFTESRHILHHLDTIAPDDRRLYPSDPEQRQQVNAWEKHCDRLLGPAVRQWGYTQRFDDTTALKALWSYQVPLWQRGALAVLFPAIHQLVGRVYRVKDAAAAERAIAQIRQSFAALGDRLADGRPYWLGDRLTAADLTFAALAAPLVQPPEHPLAAVLGTGISLAEQYRPVATEAREDQPPGPVQDLRATPAGQYVLRLYREHRRSPSAG